MGNIGARLVKATAISLAAMLFLSGCTAPPETDLSEPAGEQDTVQPDGVEENGEAPSGEEEENETSGDEESQILLPSHGVAADQITFTESDIDMRYKRISPKTAMEMIVGEAVTLVDVRTKEEFTTGFIKGAKLIPDFEIGAKAAEMLPDKNATILIYCRSGRRSAGAARTLIRLGYTAVYDFGGIIDWPYEIMR